MAKWGGTAEGARMLRCNRVAALRPGCRGIAMVSTSHSPHSCVRAHVLVISAFAIVILLAIGGYAHAHGARADHDFHVAHQWRRAGPMRTTARVGVRNRRFSAAVMWNRVMRAARDLNERRPDPRGPLQFAPLARLAIRVVSDCLATGRWRISIARAARWGPGAGR